MSDDPLVLCAGSTRLTIPLAERVDVVGSLTSITHSMLTDYEFVPRFKRYVPTKKYMRFVNASQKLYLPITTLPLITRGLDEKGYPYRIEQEFFQPTRELSIAMKKSFVPREHQVPVIEYLRKIKPYRKGLNIQTGSGKTVSSIAGMVAYGKVGMIVVSGLCDQWMRAIMEFTTVKESQVYLIRGYSSLVDLMRSNLMPEVFVFSLETLRAYCLMEERYAQLPTFEQFVRYYGIGYKIMDEVHRNFHACVQIDLHCNIPNNVYLTATFTSGNPGTRRIFNLVYPQSMRYSNGTIEKYTIANTIMYRGVVPERKCITPRGYSHNKYEKYLLARPTYLKEFFETIVGVLIRSYYVSVKKKDEKLAIFFSKLDMVSAAYKWIKHEFPQFKVTKYIGGVADKVLADNDVIVTTIQSLGCGNDVKQLRCVINTVSLKAPTAVLQLFGRLRKIEGEDTIYVDICDINIASHLRHQKERQHWLESVCKEHRVINLAGGDYGN